MTPSRSSNDDRTLRYRGLAVAALIVLMASPLATTVGAMFGALVTTERHIVGEGETVPEDQYVTAVSSSVEGTVDGDLTLFAGTVTISGTVSGNLTVFSSGTVTITPTGRVGGSLNGAASALSLQGDVDGDVFVAAGSIVVESGSGVGRDVIAFGGSTRIEGIVGRDVRGRALRMAVDGRVRGDLDVATTILTIGGTARIGGDVLYRSSSDADIAPDALIAGTITRLPAQSNFIYGIILSLANVVGFLAFVVAGLIALWLLRGVGSRATGAVLTKPIRSLLTGVLAVVVAPLVIVLLAITLVGIPIAIVLMAFVIVAFIIGAVPAVAALGNLVLLRRGGLFGAFLVGAVLWRLGIWIIPYVGGALFVLALIWGIGGWVLGAVAARRADPTPAVLLPASMIAGSDADPDWVPPRAPSAAAYEANEVDADLGDDGPDDAADPDPEPADAPASVGPLVDRDLSFGAATVTFDGDAETTDPASPDPDGPDGSSAEPDRAESDGPEPDAAGPGVFGEADSSTLDEKLAAFRSELEATNAPDDPVARGPAPQSVPEAVHPEAATSDDEAHDIGGDAGDASEGDGQDEGGPADDDEPADDGGSDWGLPRR